MSEKCSWKYDDIGECWDTDCDRVFRFMESSDRDDFKFCPYCGKEIEVVSDD